MKKIIVSIITIAATLTSCNDWLDVNTNPNVPSAVENNLLLPSIETATAAVIGGNLFNVAGFFAQYTEQAPEANQYNELCEYRFDNDLFSTSYNRLYAGALEDADVVRNQATETEAWGEYFVATVMRAYIFQVLVDYMDQAPYTEALQGNNNSMPKWDSGESIYAGILKELDEAQAKLTSSSSIPSDLMLDKDINKWIQFANALRLRIYMRSSYAQDNSAAISALVRENNFFSGDIKFDVFSDESSKRNPWYETNKVTLSANNHVGSLPIVNYLKATEDPRLADLFKKATKSSSYEGMIPGSKTKLADNKNDSYSFITAYDRPTKPVYFFTQSELQFFIAEAYVRFLNDDAKAKDAYELAIRANISTTRGLSDDPSVIYGDGKPCAWSTATTSEEKLKLIGLQKWVALCMINNVEAWSEIRRMNYPAVSAVSASDISADATKYTAGELISPWVNSEGDMVRRLYFPLTAVNLNNNTPAQVKRSAPVWWDK